MKTSKILLVASIALAATACTDHQKHVDAQEGAAAPAQPNEPVAKRMSMTSTDARISALPQKSTDCNIETVNGVGFEPGVPSISNADTAKVSGWLIDTNQKVVPSDVKVRVETEAGDKAWEQLVTAWGDRGDIVTTHDGVTAYQKSGFEVPLDLGELSAGPYNIYLVYGAPGSETACGVGRRFSVK